MALFNTDKMKIHDETDCFTCEQFDKRLKKCNGLNKVCFEYDPDTNLITNSITKEKRSISEILI